jgi:hypothetical protein
VNSTTRKMAASVLGVLGAPLLFASSAAARSAPQPAAADVKFAYDAPRVTADGDNIIWRWTLTNAGPGAAADVVLVHHLTPPLKISQLPRECRAVGDGVSCSYGTIKAGQRRTGALKAELFRDTSGTLEITGRVTWQQGTAGPDGSFAGIAPGQPKAPADDQDSGQTGPEAQAPGSDAQATGAESKTALAPAKRSTRVPW